MEKVRSSSVPAFVLGCVVCLSLSGWAWGADQSEEPADTPTTRPAAKPADDGTYSPGAKTPDVKAPKEAKLRQIRVAVFGLDVQKGLDVTEGALTDQINVLLAALPKVTIVNRSEIAKVAQEHKLAAQGLVDMSSAVKLGKFLNAQFIVVGRASQIGKSLYVVLKIVDVETTVQTTVSAKAIVERGMERVLANLSWPLKNRIRQVQQMQVKSSDGPSAALTKLAKPLVGKVVLVSVEETHISKPLRDPAAQMTIANRLRALGIKAILPTGGGKGLKDEVMRTGKYDDKKVDYLLEGDGVSARAGEVHGLISCRARVELRVIALPGKNIIATDKGLGARVDVVEAFAAKSALEDAAKQACDAIVKRLVKTLPRPKSNK